MISRCGYGRTESRCWRWSCSRSLSQKMLMRRWQSEILIDRAGQPEVITASDGGLTVTVPIRIKRRGLRKTVTVPDDDGLQYRPWDATPTPL